MLESFDFSKKENYPLRFVFAAYKSSKDPELMNEIYKRTFSTVFVKILSHINDRNHAASKVQEVYRNMALTLTRLEAEADIEKYLQRQIYNCIEVNLIEHELKQA